jgi:hypothetical protein
VALIGLGGLALLALRKQEDETSTATQ